MLIYDLKTDLYLVNDTVYKRNLKLNVIISFSIGNSATASNDAVFITFLYTIFDLTALFLLYNSTIKYFLIKRAINGVYILGRTLLQEVYFIIDYERRNFTIAYANFLNPMPAKYIVFIYPLVSKQNSSKVLPKDHLRGSVIASISIGIAVFIIFVIAILSYFILQRYYLV